jgi:CBS domain-containing protein
MNTEDIRQRIKAKLYGEELTRGVMEFAWGNDDPNLFNERLKAAKEECLKSGVRWVDADPMSSKIVVVTPKDYADAVADIMTKYGFNLVNQIFDPKPTEMLRGKDTP